MDSEEHQPVMSIYRLGQHRLSESEGVQMYAVMFEAGASKDCFYGLITAIEALAQQREVTFNQLLLMMYHEHQNGRCDIYSGSAQ